MLSLTVLSGTLVTAQPAAAAPCTPFNCYQYWADITITASTNPSSTPVFPGSDHTYTIRVSNTGWRTGGSSGPTPWPGPDAAPVYVVIQPSSPDEVPVAKHIDSGVPFQCSGYHGGMVCWVDTSTPLPTGTTSQFTVTFRAPTWTGSYSCTIYADSYGWTEYNENNNTVTLSYQVGYLA